MEHRKYLVTNCRLPSHTGRHTVPVNEQLSASFKTGGAVDAGVRELKHHLLPIGPLAKGIGLGVYEPVLLERAGLGEGLAAAVTGVGLGAGVRVAVPRQVALVGEGLVACLAAVALLARVAVDVGEQVAAALEDAAAVGAGVRRGRPFRLRFAGALRGHRQCHPRRPLRPTAPHLQPWTLLLELHRPEGQETGHVLSF